MNVHICFSFGERIIQKQRGVPATQEHWAENLLLVTKNSCSVPEQLHIQQPEAKTRLATTFSAFISIMLHGKLKCTTAGKCKNSMTLSFYLSWEAASSKWRLRWTKILIHCQGEDILHMIGPCRLIKAPMQVTDSFFSPLCAFPSKCSTEMSKTSIYHIYFCSLLQTQQRCLSGYKAQALKTCRYWLSTFGQVRTSRVQSGWWPYLLLMG